LIFAISSAFVWAGGKSLAIIVPLSSNIVGSKLSPKNPNMFSWYDSRDFLIVFIDLRLDGNCDDLTLDMALSSLSRGLPLLVDCAVSFQIDLEGSTDETSSWREISRPMLSDI
jgi:hypothetical protein